VAGKVAYSMELILRALVFGIVTATRSLRDVENRSVQVAAKSAADLDSTSKIADNTFGKVLWSRHPKGVFIVSLLRRIGLNIMAVVRQLSRLSHTKERPTWHQVAEHFFLVHCGSILQTEAFDAEIC